MRRALRSRGGPGVTAGRCRSEGDKEGRWFIDQLEPGRAVYNLAHGRPQSGFTPWLRDAVTSRLRIMVASAPTPFPSNRCLRHALAAVLCAAIAFSAAAADLPWNYAVQVSATVDAVRSQITLQWVPPDSNAFGGVAPQHFVYRKRVSELGNPDWGAGTAVPPGQNSYVDTVDAGIAYEYKVTRIYPNGDPQFNGVGYVRTGMRVPLVENRGTVLIVPESNTAPALSAELDQFANDCVGDGWRVVRVDGFSSNSNPVDLQARIREEYRKPAANVQAVFLIGHLPVVFSGTATNPDGHQIRAMPADGFYGDVTGDWGPASFDGQHWVYQKNTFPASLALAVGRVDFADMPAVEASSPFNSEVALLKNYFAKDHAYRTGQRVPLRRALIGDAFGEYYFEGVVEPFSAEGYRNFAALLGNQITVLDNYHGASNASQWLDAVSGGSFVFAYGAGAGGESGDSIAALGPNDALTSRDLVARDAKAEFYLFFGSYIVDWTRPDNLLRAALAPAEYGLASAWAGRPFLYFHAMGLGETLGYGLRISENGSGTLYDTPVKVRPSGNTYVGAVYLALLGDPTLRLDPIPPVANVASNAITGAVSWSPPPGVQVQEYRVYALNPANGGYDLESIVPAGTTTYTAKRVGLHMIRAVALQRGSGTYYDASEGIFWNATVAGSPGTMLDTVGPASIPDPALPQARFAIPVLVPGR
jgi:hypothetical protein